MVSSDADHRSYQRRRPLQALRWRERRSCHLSLGSRCPACEEASVKVACRRVRGRRRPQRPVPGANDGALAANTQCQPAEARTSPPALARPSPETNYEARLKSRTSPLKVEDVAARNGPPPDTNDEARSRSRTSPPAPGYRPTRTTRPAQSRGRRLSKSRTSPPATGHLPTERRGPLKVEDVAAQSRGRRRPRRATARH